MPKVSVVIPVFNVEAFLPECINSLLEQTEKDIELVFVNDGSTDGSRAILEDYLKKDSRIRLLNKKNEGIALARPYGVSSSAGEYILFVDSDDYLPLNSIEILYAEAKKNDCDVVAGSFSKVNDGCHENIIRQIFEKVNGEVFIRHMLEVNDFYLWGKLFKRDLLKKEVYVDKSIFYGEDTILLSQLVMIAKNISSIKENIYFYRIRTTSVTYKMTQESMLSRLKASNFLYEFLSKKNIEYSTSISLKSYYLWQIFRFLIEGGIITEYTKTIVTEGIKNNLVYNIKKELDKKNKKIYPFLVLAKKSLIFAKIVAIIRNKIKLQEKSK